MDTNDRATDDDRTTRSAVNPGPDEQVDSGNDESAGGSRARSEPHPSLLVGLIGIIVRLLEAQAPALLRQVKDKLTAFFQPRRDDGEPGVQERLADAGSRVVDWSRSHPGQAVAIGAAVLTTAVVVGIMLHNSADGRDAYRTSSSTARRGKRSRGKIGKRA